MCRFLPAPSARRATLSITQQPASINISIHALREEGDQADRPEITTHCAISIHALREEGDFLAVIALRGHHISIHALREEGDFESLVN